MHGLLAGAAHVGSSLAPHTTEFDGAAFASGAFFGTRSNTVAQGFERRFASIDYKIKRQKLHREDVRDLVELTTARMHIYHLVGTLLLAFCMGWYTDTGVWDLPVWYSNLWLISNFAAVGYLIMCVWLAMYASVAARSIGTRLLTSYARLALPTKKEIEDIKKPIFFNVGDIIRRQFRRNDSDTDQLTQGPAGCESSEVMVESEDDCQHFKRFLEELPRWLVYDTWARVCMSYGMNQMLNALSYFSMGQFWSKSPLAAIMSFVSIHILQFIVLWLDIGDLYETWYDTFAIVFFSVLPAVLAVILLLHEWWFGQFGKSVTVFVCFAAHAGWLWYLNTLFQHAGSQDGRFQPGNFANVLEWVQGDKRVEEAPAQPSDPPKKVLGKKSSGSRDLDIPELLKEAHKKIIEEESDSNAKSQNATDTSQPIGKDVPVMEPMNGGRSPGLWKTSTRRKYGEDTPHVLSDYWLPVRLIKYLTFSTIGWWLLAGIMHAVVIEYDGYNVYKEFTGDDVSRTMRSRDILPNLLQLAPEVPVKVQWPEPARLFKVAALYCGGGSEVLVSSGFSLYSMSLGSAPLLQSRSLSVVRDGSIGSVVCAAQRGCDALSPPARAEGSWLLTPLEGGNGTVAPVALPHSWRLIAGSWTKCPADASSLCTDAQLVGWDGRRLFAASLKRDKAARSWAVHTQFEVDPLIGLCARSRRSCARREAKRYQDVKALQLSSDGRMLMVLLGAGIIDVWDLNKGSVSKVLQLGGTYTSMCSSGGKILLSRESSSGPVLVSMDLPSPFAGSAAARPRQLLEANRTSLVAKRSASPTPAKRAARFLSRHQPLKPDVAR